MGHSQLPIFLQVLWSPLPQSMLCELNAQNNVGNCEQPLNIYWKNCNNIYFYLKFRNTKYTHTNIVNPQCNAIPIVWNMP